MERVPGRRTNSYRYLYRGYVYNKVGKSERYRCASRLGSSQGCNGSAKVDEAGNVRISRAHNHMADPERGDRIAMREQMKSLARTTKMPPKEIFNLVRSNGRFSTVDINYESVRSTMFKERAMARSPKSRTLGESGTAIADNEPTLPIDSVTIQDGSSVNPGIRVKPMDDLKVRRKNSTFTAQSQSQLTSGLVNSPISPLIQSTAVWSAPLSERTNGLGNPTSSRIKMADARTPNADPMESYYSRGEHTLKVPMSLFRKNRDRLVQSLRTTSGVPDSGAVVLLQGGEEVPFNDTDVNYEFRQESFFQWCYGVEEPDCMGALDIATGTSILFVPQLPKEYEIWCGKLKTTDEFKKIYRVDRVCYTTEISDVLAGINAKLILTLHGQNSDSKLFSREATFEGIERFVVNNEILFPVISECRVIKTPEEMEVLRYVAQISSDAHKVVMQNVSDGSTEYQAEALFKHYAYSNGGCRHVSYTCICGSGHNGSYLHYGHAGAPNNKIIKDGDMCLFDMGGNYCGYAADITCSFPANGKFTENQKLVYNAVLGARNAVIGAARHGAQWTDMHLLANRIMLMMLRDGGLLKGDVDDMMNAGLNETFQPHGLGHFLGLDVHDAGGYLPGNPERPEKPGIRKLRTARTLQAGMVLTIEPGCYFIDYLLDEALVDPIKKEFFVVEKLEQFRGFGGVRIEDDVLITENGVENFTFVPRTVEEIEEWMAEGKSEESWPQE